MSQSTDDRTEQEGTTQEWSSSARHALLESGRRRHVLDVLADEPAPTELEELATVVAARENDVDDTDLNDTDLGETDLDEMTVHLVAASLHHAHLPKLDDAGVVDYDTDANRVRPHLAAIDALTPYSLTGT